MHSEPRDVISNRKQEKRAELIEKKHNVSPKKAAEWFEKIQTLEDRSYPVNYYEEWEYKNITIYA